LRDLLLTGDRATGALLRARVRMRPLTAHRQTTTVPDPAVGTDVHQSLDVHRHFGAQRTFDLVVALDDAADLVDVRIREIAHAERRIDARLLYDLRRVLAADPIDVRETDLELFVARKVDAG